jgi:hypothetical protein
MHDVDLKRWHGRLRYVKTAGFGTPSCADQTTEFGIFAVGALFFPEMKAAAPASDAASAGGTTSAGILPAF